MPTSQQEPISEASRLDAGQADTYPASAASAEPGVIPQRIGRFVILRQLGVGGMGVVYAAYDENLDRKVAVKVMRHAQMKTAEQRARVLREAQALGRNPAYLPRCRTGPGCCARGRARASRLQIWNGDGQQDVAVIDYDLQQLKVLFGDGRGGLGPSRDMPLIAESMVAADFNGDGNQDLVATNQPGAQVLFGDGQGGFTAMPPFLNEQVLQIETGDWNGDRNADLAVVTRRDFTQFIKVLLSDGRGGFAQLQRIDFETFGTIWVRAADFNHDGHLDIVWGSQLNMLLGDGKGGFTHKMSSISTLIDGSQVLDLNQNGNLDLMNTRLLLWGDGMGDFSVETLAGFGGYARFGDWNGDHKPDALYGDTEFRVYQGTGTSAFQYPLILGTYGRVVASADFIGDHKEDLVVLGSGLQILLNLSK